VGQILFFLTTEHSTLQGARSTTASERNGRISILLGTVSSGLIALGFIGRDARQTFVLFGLILFTLPFVLEFFTFERVLQSSIEDITYARGINRIRHFYLGLVPEMADYFVLSSNDGVAGALHTFGVRQTRWQLLFTAAGMVSVINSVIAGAFFGFAVFALSKAAIAAGSVAVGVLLLSALLHERYQLNVRIRAALKPLFPSGSWASMHLLLILPNRKFSSPTRCRDVCESQGEVSSEVVHL